MELVKPAVQGLDDFVHPERIGQDLLTLRVDTLGLARSQSVRSSGGDLTFTADGVAGAAAHADRLGRLPGYGRARSAPTSRAKMRRHIDVVRQGHQRVQEAVLMLVQLRQRHHRLEAASYTGDTAAETITIHSRG
jgi:hypothetical protein